MMDAVLSECHQQAEDGLAAITLDLTPTSAANKRTTESSHCFFCIAVLCLVAESLVAKNLVPRVLWLTS